MLLSFTIFLDKEGAFYTLMEENLEVFYEFLLKIMVSRKVERFELSTREQFEGDFNFINIFTFEIFNLEIFKSE